MLRRLLSWLLVLLTPAALIAADADTAVLYGTGSVYLNGSLLSNSSAVTTGDVIQTKETGAANLNAAGSTVVIESNTIVRFQSSGLALDRGSVSVATGKGLSVFARDFKISPVSSAWTEFYTSRATALIHIIPPNNSITVTPAPTTPPTQDAQQVPPS